MATTTHTMSPIVGVILAGGLSRRMQGNKSQAQLHGVTLLQHTYTKAAPQVNDMLLNSNTPEAISNAPFTAVISDIVEGFAGPLAGILTAMEWCEKNRPNARWLASFTVDAPFIPTNLVRTLENSLKEIDANYVCAASYGRRHPLFALWPIQDTIELRNALIHNNLRKVQDWTQRYNVLEIDFTPSTTLAIDPFFNINTPGDLTTAANWLMQESNPSNQS